jgi:hypothetical protein
VDGTAEGDEVDPDGSGYRLPQFEQYAPGPRLAPQDEQPLTGEAMWVS